MGGLRWTQEDWLDEATAWIRDRVAVAGEIEQPHVRWWSTVLRVPTRDGPVWFKATAPSYRFEAALVAALAEWRPGDGVPLIATDTERGWILMADGGTRLREVFARDPDPARWAEIYPGYAQLQIDLAARREEMVALGVPTLPLDELAPAVHRVLDDSDALLLGEAEGLTSEQHERLRQIDVGELADRLAAYGIPESLQHDDLHDGNVFLHDGDYRIFDWGDSVISHPFHSLVVGLRATAWKFKLEPGAPVLVRLRDSYLEPWTAFASRSELLEAFALAYRLGTLARALAWYRHLEMRASAVGDRDDAESIPYGLRLFLENGPVGSWR